MRISSAGKSCKDCTDRYVGCHQHCEKYKKARDEDFEIKKAIYKNKNESNQIMGYYKDAQEKRRKRHG